MFSFVIQGYRLRPRARTRSRTRSLNCRELLRSLHIEGAIVTADAMHCQKETTKTIRDGGADYLLQLRENQPSLYADIALYAKENAEKWPCHEETDAGRGRIETRKCYASDDVEWLKERHPDWRDLHSVAVMKSERVDKKTGKISLSERLYVTLLPPEAGKIADAARGHWSVENSLHWILDVTFKDDGARPRAESFPHNFSVIKRIALNLLNLENSALSVKRKRIRASLKSSFLKKMLNR